MAQLRKSMIPFVKDEAGNIGMIFAMMILPTCMILGMSLDFGRGYDARTKMQSNLDSSVLAAAKTFDSTGSTQAAEQKARDFFTSLTDPAVHAEITQASADAQGNIHLSAKGYVETGFLKITGLNKLDVSSTASSLTVDQGKASSIGAWW